MAEDVASVPDGVPASDVAEMGDFSAGAAAVERDGGALLRISQAFCDLAECLLTRLEDFRDVGALLEVGIDTAGSAELPQTSVSIEVPRPELLRAVAGTLRRLAGGLVSDIKGNEEVQELMPAIQKVSAATHHAFLQEWMRIGEQQQPSPGNVVSPPREETPVCISSTDLGTASTGGAGDGSVAEVANFSPGGTSEEQSGETALLRISQAFYGLGRRLPASLEEFRKAEHALELESAGGRSPDQLFQTRVSGDEARPDLLRGVVGALKEMVEALVSAIKGDTDVQRLMPAMQKASVANHHAFFQDLMSTPELQRSCSGDFISANQETLAQTSSNDSTIARRRAGKGLVTCKHSCHDHPQVLDPWLWKDLALVLKELGVYAQLPIRNIVENVECDKNWHTMLKTSSLFRRACSESHQTKLFGLLGRTVGHDTMWTTLYDTESKEWLSIELTGLPGTVPDCRWEPKPEDDLNDAYKCSMSASDGGLVCFVPHEHLTCLPILVCNPLTSIWKALPLIAHDVDFENREADLVQLVVEDDTKSYRVLLVSSEIIGGAMSTAHFYSSETKMWSIMDNGPVHGVEHGFRFDVGTKSTPGVFECRTKDLNSYVTSYVNVGVAWARDHFFELSVDNTGFIKAISEYVWSSRSSDLEWVKNLDDSPLQPLPDPCGTLLFPSSNFVMIIADNFMNWLEEHRQYIGLYDRATGQWEILPPLPRRRDFHYERLRMSLAVDLRWDIDP